MRLNRRRDLKYDSTIEFTQSAIASIGIGVRVRDFGAHIVIH